MLFKFDVFFFFLKQIFRPLLDEYDILIKLRNIMNPLRHMSIDAKMAKIYTLEPPKDNEKIPIVGLNPIQELLNVLRVFKYYIIYFILYLVSHV